MTYPVETAKTSPGWNVIPSKLTALVMDMKTSSEEQTSWGRLCIEFLLCFAIAGRVFGYQIGILNVLGLSGAIIAASGFACFVIMLARREPLPISLLFAVIINGIANLTDLYHIGLFNRDLIYWTSFLLMACYIVRNKWAAWRFGCFLAATVLISVVLSGSFLGTSGGFERLALSGRGVGQMFANANDLAQLALVVGVALLFSSLRLGLVAKLICWGTFLALSAVVLLTLSRQGLFMLGCGFIFFLLASLKGKGKIGVIALAFLALALAGLNSERLENIVSGYEYRLSLPSARVAYWESAPREMMDTLISGRGTFDSFTAEGIKPHSTFLWLHLAYGGPCAWIYAGWILYLMVKTIQLVFGREAEWTVRMEVAAMFSLFFLAQFTTVFAPGNYGFILAVATLEREFTAKTNPQVET
ncbi:MAG: hypothetical protein JXB25_06325 [Deltaproteobacteria bacterium]|nr:hypothetical protein [Deltaproteobacteria bacterium]